MKIPRSPRILIADDHALIRDSIPLILEKRFPCAHFGKASNTQEVRTAIEQHQWDMLILDLGLPGDRELQTLKSIRAQRPSLPILVLSMMSESKMGVRAMQAGASGYLCKTANMTIVESAIAQTLAGTNYISEFLRDKLSNTTTQTLGLLDLSQRETEVLLEFGRGFSAKEIAGKLDVTVSSVGTYRARILEKLQLTTTAELVRYVTEQRLLNS